MKIAHAMSSLGTETAFEVLVKAKALEAQFDQVTFEHVRRTENTEADRLSNVAMDAQEALEEERSKESEDRSQKSGESRRASPSSGRVSGSTST